MLIKISCKTADIFNTIYMLTAWTNNQYVSNAILSLDGSMHLAGLCSKQSVCKFNILSDQLVKLKIDRKLFSELLVCMLITPFKIADVC